MSRFAAVLGEISERLSLPQPARARVLAEIAGDLDDLYRTFLERGDTEEEAEREALRRVDLSDEALRELVRVHGSLFRRVSDGIAERAGSRWELALMGVLVVAAVFLSGAVVQAAPMSRAAGRWLVPVVFGALATLGIGVWKAYVLWLRGDHRPAGLRTGLGAMLGLSVFQLFLAFGGVGITAYRVVRTVRIRPEEAGAVTMDWLLGALALLVMSLSLVLVGGLAWFAVLGKVSSIERAEAAACLPD